MKILRDWRRRRLLKNRRFDDVAWQSAWEALPLLHRLGKNEQQKLRELALSFLHEKHLETAGGLILDDTMRARLALLASLPILNLGLDWYGGWHSMILYPGEFVPKSEWIDEVGVVHELEEVRSGESWLRGPVILSWEDVLLGGQGNGYNVVIHELAHKLDALDGTANGMPPLHTGMVASEWTKVFTSAFYELTLRVERGEVPFIDPYAVEAPEEFFAVVSEYFFELPQKLLLYYPDIYHQLRVFYRQDPLKSD